ncbi:MAG TPA: MFS transporter, partial [Candidatus Binataceae bacterium]|nr:MFS transporter [Candidatus Binataceae bacterium]
MSREDPDLEASLALAGFTRDYWLVFTASFLLACADNLFVLFPAFVAELGATPSKIGAILGLGSLAALVMRPGATGSIARRGQRWTSVVFMMLNAAAMVLYIAVDHLGWKLWLVRAIQGAVDGTARVAIFAMIYDRLPASRQGYGMTIFSLSSIVPAALAPPMGEVLIHWRGFRAFFIACATLVVAAAATAGAVAESPHGSSAAKDSEASVSYRALMFDRKLVPLWVGSSVFAITLTARFSFVAPFAYDSGLRSVGWYFLLCAGIAALTRLASRHAIDAALDRAVVPALVILAIGTAMVASVPNIAMLAAAAVIGGIGQG